MTSDSPRQQASATTKQSPPSLGTVASSPDRGSLVVVHSSDSAAIGGRLALGHDVVVVGRDVDDARFRVKDDQLSRAHFRIVYDRRAAKHRLGDNRSRNGTIVDG